MLFQIGDSSQPQFPQPPQPPQRQEAQAAHAQPMVYVYESPAWEYKVLARDVTGEQLLSEQELNGLGTAGWELAGVATVGGIVRFYLKRPRK
jgi:hypothetical protein